MSLNVKVIPGGLLRCCFLSLETNYALFPDFEARNGDRLNCKYCGSWIVYDADALYGQGAWKWDQ